MFLHVTSAKHIDKYRIELQFNDGRAGVADLEADLHGKAFEPLKDIALFSKLRVDDELQTVVWPNGVDLAPEFLYYKAFAHVQEFQQQFERWGYTAVQQVD